MRMVDPPAARRTTERVLKKYASDAGLDAAERGILRLFLQPRRVGGRFAGPQPRICRSYNRLVHTSRL
jgi:hypothetical protein